MEVIVAQLPEWLLPTPDDQGLNPIMNIYWPTLNFKEDGNKEKGREWIVDRLFKKYSENWLALSLLRCHYRLNLEDVVSFL